MKNTCKVCGATDNDAEFYTGLASRCKECHKAAVRVNRAENLERYRAYDAKRFKDDPRVLARHRLYQSTPDGIKSSAKSHKKWLAANQDKRAAHIILGNAVRDGKKNKPDTCELCGTGGRIHGHHEDYTKPLDVIWCCPTCHHRIHNPLPLSGDELSPRRLNRGLDFAGVSG